MNERGHYGGNGAHRVGQVPVYITRESPSTAAWIVGVAAAAGAVLWARHQSRQIEQLYKTAGLPYQSFTAGLKQSARQIPSRARQAIRGRASAEPASAAATEEPEHSVKRRAR
jgi:hypothetical protein